MSEISINALSEKTGLTVANLSQLVKRGILPAGRKDGKTRMLPYVETMLLLAGHEPGKHWVKQRTRPGKRKNKTHAPDISWADVL